MYILVYGAALCAALTVVLSGCGSADLRLSPGELSSSSSSGWGSVHFDPKLMASVSVTYVSKPGMTDSLNQRLELTPDHERKKLKFSYKSYDGESGDTVNCIVSPGDSTEASELYGHYEQGVAQLAVQKSAAPEYGSNRGDIYIQMIDVQGNPVAFPVTGSASTAPGAISFARADLLLEVFAYLRQSCEESSRESN